MKEYSYVYIIIRLNTSGSRRELTSICQHYLDAPKRMKLNLATTADPAETDNRIQNLISQYKACFILGDIADKSLCKNIGMSG